jgi:hypothetical protein
LILFVAGKAQHEDAQKDNETYGAGFFQGAAFKVNNASKLAAIFWASKPGCMQTGISAIRMGFTASQ